MLGQKQLQMAWNLKMRKLMFNRVVMKKMNPHTRTLCVLRFIVYEKKESTGKEGCPVSGGGGEKVADGKRFVCEDLNW